MRVSAWDRESPYGGENTSPPQDIMDEETRRALLKRPSLNIRTRLTVGFLLFFFLAAAATSLALYTVHGLEKKLHFLELADRYTFEIQQARRFEKNYFLYGTDLRYVLEHIESAQRLLSSAKEGIGVVIGIENLQIMERNLKTYKDVLLGLVERQREKGSGVPVENAGVEAELRSHGSEMVAVALNIARKERREVEVTLKRFKLLPLFFLGALLALTLYSANFLARQMLGPLNRLMETTQRIARGEFTPHQPARRYKDEFTNLAMAINRMMREILRHQEILVESHKIKALGTLTAGVAHQLNNPLSNISTSCQILLEELADKIPETHAGILNSIESEVIRARDIVRALLEYSRERDFELKPVDLRQLVDDTLRLIKGELPHNVEVRVEIAEGVVLRLDKARMQEALLNLVINGIQAMPEGGSLAIQGLVDEASRMVTLNVTDTGVGIPEEHISSIFDPFFTTKDVGKGTGLGLSVVYSIIERHGGKIGVQSRPGKGTTFSIRLPLGPTRP